MTTENQTSNNYSRPTGTNGSYLKCKRWSFRFGDAKTRLLKLLERKEEAVENMQEQPSQFKKVTAIIAILVGIGLSIIEATNVSNTIAATTGLSNELSTLVGALFSAVGMLAGEMVSNTKRDEFTGKRQFTAQQGLGLLLILIYLGGQYYIASRAEIGAGDMQETIHTMTAFILGIGIIEVLFGALFLKTAIQVSSLLIIDIRIRLIIRSLNQSSKHTDEMWNRHLYEVQMHNEANTTNLPHGELTPIIREAIEYYSNGGFTNSN